MATQDGRLVINQPLIGFDASGAQFVFSSLQGRSDGTSDMFSHKGSIDHAFDWGGAVSGDNVVYVVAPVDSYIVFINDSETDGDESAFGGEGGGPAASLLSEPVACSGQENSILLNLPGHTTMFLSAV